MNSSLLMARTWSAGKRGWWWRAVVCGSSRLGWRRSSGCTCGPRPAARGLAAALLGALEDAASALGYRAVRLDTGPRQEHALKLYRRSGYVEVPPYNDNPYACYWAEKQLAQPPAFP